ncbi:hypothetical protein ScPMuIL_017788 [Solemya velum]
MNGGCNLKIPAWSIEPSFDVPFMNVTIVAGRTAVLPCSVEHLGKYKVVWTDPWNTLLSQNDRRIIHDYRISVERPYGTDWNLHIREVRYKDRGQYTCQLNTNPIKTKTIMLHVLVPPEINDDFSGSDKIVREGETVILACDATGAPMPEIQWWKSSFPQTTYDRMTTKYRLNLILGYETSIGQCTYKEEQQGLVIQNMSRYCGGIYECMASNDVAPAATRQIKVEVEFQPEVNLPNKRLGQSLGREVILECVVRAFPMGITEWRFHGEPIHYSNKKYRVEIYNEAMHTVTISLTIKNLQETDYGPYICRADNYLGEDREAMTLYESTHKTTISTTRTTTLGGFQEPEEEIIINPSNTPVGPKYPNLEQSNQAGNRSASFGSNRNGGGCSMTNYPFFCLFTLLIILYSLLFVHL